MALGATLIWLNITSMLSFVGLALIGLALAPLFPSLIATMPERLGNAHTANGVGFQIAAAVLSVLREHACGGAGGWPHLLPRLSHPWA